MTIEVFKFIHQNQERIGVRNIGFDPDFPVRMKKIKGAYWMPELRHWLIPYNPETYTLFRTLFSDTVIEIKTIFNFETPIETTEKKPVEKIPLNQLQEEALTRFIETLMLKRYSYATIKSYRNAFTQFLLFFPAQHPADIEEDDIKRYCLQKIEENKWSESYQNQVINAIKFYYEKVLGQQRKFYELRPKKPQQLPQVFTEHEVVLLLKSVDNLKHKCILMLIYSAGLRLGELTQLRIDDINTAQKSVFVKAGKGKKDRRTLLSDKMILYLNR